MNEPLTPQENKGHTKSIIIALTIISMTCIISCAVVLVILIMRIP